MNFKHVSITLFFIFSSYGLLAQRTLISGEVKNDSTNIPFVHVFNKSAGLGTLTNEKGHYKMRVKTGDTLFFSEISYKTKEVVIDKKITGSGKLNVKLAVNINKLDEVVIFKNKQLTNPLGLPNWGKTPLNKEEREINFYSQEPLFMVILMMLATKQGGIDDLWYVLSGERKKFRKLQNLKKQDEENAYNLSICQDIRKHFGDDFFKDTLKIDPADIEPFLLACIPRKIVSLYNENRELELMDVLVSESQRFKHN